VEWRVDYFEGLHDTEKVKEIRSKINKKGWIL